MDSSIILQIAEKLETKGDISKEEADIVYNFFTLAKKENTTEIIIPKLTYWYLLVRNRLKRVRSGNFITTIPLLFESLTDWRLREAIRKCINLLPGEQKIEYLYSYSQEIKKEKSNKPAIKTTQIKRVGDIPKMGLHVFERAMSEMGSVICAFNICTFRSCAEIMFWKDEKAVLYAALTDFLMSRNIEMYRGSVKFSSQNLFLLDERALRLAKTVMGTSPRRIAYKIKTRSEPATAQGALQESMNLFGGKLSLYYDKDNQEDYIYSIDNLQYRVDGDTILSAVCDAFEERENRTREMESYREHFPDFLLEAEK